MRVVYNKLKDNRGVALIEFALVLPILLLLVLGIIEFGWIYNGYITITGAAREGARVAAIDGDYEVAVNNHISSLLIGNEPAFKINNIIQGGSGEVIIITVEGDLSLLIGSTFPLKAEAIMRKQF